MIFLTEHHLIVSLGFKIRRIAIKKGIRSVILTDECLKILILDYGILQPAVCLPDDGKGFAYVKRLASIRGASAPIAVADNLIECRRPFHITYCGTLHEDVTDFCRLRFF